MQARINLTIEGGVANVRLNRPEKMNALDKDMFTALIETGERLKTEAGVRAVVISGEGRAFCAGLDMSSFDRMRKEGGIEGPGGTVAKDIIARTHGNANGAQQAVMVWRQIPVPVIAAVHGVAFGGGFQVALGADIRYVTPDVRMSVMEIKWGLVPDMAGILLMRDLARADVIRELTFSGRQFSGEEAVQFGLATRVEADPYAAAMAYARSIAEKNPAAIRAGKRLLNLSLEGDEAAILMAESVEQKALMGSPNQKEAVLANLEKRAPVFKD